MNKLSALLDRATDQQLTQLLIKMSHANVLLKLTPEGQRPSDEAWRVIADVVLTLEAIEAQQEADQCTAS